MRVRQNLQKFSSQRYEDVGIGRVPNCRARAYKTEISSNIVTSGRIQRMADQNTGNVARTCWLLNFQSESQEYFNIIFVVSLLCQGW